MGSSDDSNFFCYAPDLFQEFKASAAPVGGLPVVKEKARDEVTGHSGDVVASQGFEPRTNGL
jgi:hypothetical protein